MAALLTVHAKLRQIQTVRSRQVGQIIRPLGVEVHGASCCCITTVDIAAQISHQSKFEHTRAPREVNSNCDWLARMQSIGGDGGHSSTGFVDKLPAWLWGANTSQAHHVLEHTNGVVELHRTIAIKIGRERLVRGQRVPGIDIQSDHHLEDGNGVLQVDSGVGGLKFINRNGPAGLN